MAAAAILENQKIAISRPCFDQFQPNLARRCNSTLLSCPTVKNLKFWKSKMAAAASSKNRKIAIVRPLWAFRLLKFQKIKSPRWQWPPSWKIKKSPYLRRGLTFEQFREHLAWWLSLTLFTVPVVNISKFLESGMAVTAILKIQKSPYRSYNLTDRYNIWYGDACWPSWPCWPSKLRHCDYIWRTSDQIFSIDSSCARLA